MRVVVRLLSPLLGLALAAAGALVVVEVVTAWVRPDGTTGLLVPWPSWRSTAEQATWSDGIVAAVAIGAAVLGLLLVLAGLLARRHDVVLRSPAEGITVTTSPRVMARLVGRAVRASDQVAEASVTATARRIKVRAGGWGEPDDELRRGVRGCVDTVLDDLPLVHRPRVAVSVRGRKGHS